VLFREKELDKNRAFLRPRYDILEFVKMSEMDPLYFESSYY